MAFGPLGTDSEQSLPILEAEPELLGRVRAAAERLVDDLKRAETLTHQWLDEALGEALIEVALCACLRRLARTGCSGEANRVPSGELWRLAGPFLETGTLQRRARLKPRGYAGDHELLAQIAARQCCDHPLGRHFDRFFQRQAAPQAVRARMQQTAASLVAHRLRSPSGEYRVASVGSGPGIDLRQALETLPGDARRGLRVTLLDLDPAALEFARRQLDPLLAPGAVEAVRENLYRLTQRPRAALPEHTHFLVCSGLFDYLEDEAAIGLLQAFWRSLASGGLLLVGNFAPLNPTRAYMEWVGNWYLIYRTAEKLDRLAEQAGIPRNCRTIAADHTGIDLFLIARK